MRESTSAEVYQIFKNIPLALKECAPFFCMFKFIIGFLNILFNLGKFCFKIFLESIII